MQEAQAQREHKKRQRQRRRDEHAEICAEVVARCEKVFERFPLTPLPQSTSSLSWQDMPASLSPLHNLFGERGLKKQQQCESFARALASLIGDRKQVKIVDFGSGSGNASLPLAFWFRDVASFVLVDRFDEPIRIARDRVALSGLKNVECVVSYIKEAPVGGFDIGFSSHACGTATDDALAQCLKVGASFCLTSCCVGKIKFAQDEELPRSQLVRSIVSRDQFLHLCRAAEHDTNYVFDETKAKSKLLLEADRLQLATEAGYNVHRTKLEPSSCSPKNDCLLGEKRNELLTR